MKKLAFTFLLLLVCSSTFAQSSTLPIANPPVSPTLFPLGGFDVSTFFPQEDLYDALLRDFSSQGLNTIFSYDRQPWQPGFASHMPSGIASYQEPLGSAVSSLNPGLGYFTATHGTGWSHFADRQFFLMSSLQSDFDYQTVNGLSGIGYWTSLGHGNQAPSPRIEWLNSPSAADEPMILNVHYSNPPEDHFMYDLTTSTDSVVCDFVFRLDGTKHLLNSSQTIQDVHNQALYDVTAVSYFSTYDNNNVETRHAIDEVHQTVSLDDYTALTSDGTRPEGNTSAVTAFPSLNSLEYAVKRINLHTNADNTVTNRRSLNIPHERDTKDIGFRTHIEFTLSVHSSLGATPAPIFVRGFRIRTTGADSLFTKQYDGHLLKLTRFNVAGSSEDPRVSGFKQIKNGSVSAWDRILYITGNGEQYWHDYRAIAYVDDIFFREAHKHMISFLCSTGGADYRYYRAIYEDQNKYPPPFVVQESFTLGGFHNLLDAGTTLEADAMPDATILQVASVSHLTGINSIPYYATIDDAGDGKSERIKVIEQIDDTHMRVIRGQQGTTALQLGHIGVTLSQPVGFQAQDAIPFFIRHQRLSPFDAASASNPEVFTDMGFQLQPGTNAGYDLYTASFQAALSDAWRDHGRAAEAAYKYNSAQQSRWWAMLHASVSTPFSNFAKIHLLWKTDVDDPDVLNNIRKPLIDNIKTQNPSPVTARVEDISSNWNSVKDQLRGEWRGCSQSEMRAEAWSALCQGAKGLFWNTIGSDQGDNGGITDRYGFHWNDSRVPESSGSPLYAFYTGTPNPVAIGDECSAPFVLHDGSSDLSFTDLVIHSKNGQAHYDGNNWLAPYQYVPLVVNGAVRTFASPQIPEALSYVWEANGQMSYTLFTKQFSINKDDWEAVDLGANEKVRVSIKGSPTGGSFTLSFNGGPPSGAIAPNATAIQVQSVLAQSLGTPNFSCTITEPSLDQPDRQLLIEFKGALARVCSIPVVSNSSLSGGTDARVSVEILNHGHSVDDQAAAGFHLYPPNDNFPGQFEAYPFDTWTTGPIHDYRGASSYWPFSGAALNVSAPIYYGWKERWNAVGRITSDVKPIANYLSSLIWQGALAYHDVDLSDKSSDFQKNYPITNLHSFPVYNLYNNVRNFKGNFAPENTKDPFWPLSTEEPNSSALYNLGRFVDKHSEHYLAIGNRRTWPLKLYHTKPGGSNIDGPDQLAIVGIESGDASHTEGLLGTKDARQLIFSLNKSVLDPDNRWINFQVYNLRNGDIQAGCFPCQYKVQFSPGEGTLLKFFPLVSTRGGISDGQIANNNRQIELSPHQDFSPTHDLASIPGQVVMTYSHWGNLAISVATDSTFGYARRYIGNPIDSLIDTSGYANNPGLDFNATVTDGIGLIYSRDSVDTLGVRHTAVVFRAASPNNPYNFTSVVTLDTFTTTDVPAAPTLTVATAGTGKHWAGWRSSTRGEVVALLDSNGHIIAQKSFCASSISQTRFLTLGSHTNISQLHTGGKDTCYAFFEEGLHDQSKIYFLKIWKSGSTTLDSTGLQDITKSIPFCDNHTPAVAVTHNGKICVAYDACRYSVQMQPNGVLHPTHQHFTLTQARLPNGEWTNATTWHAFDQVLDSGTVDMLSSWPVISAADYLDSTTIHPTDSTWLDLERVAYSDAVNNQVHVAHYGFIGQNRTSPWQSITLDMPAAHPMMAQATTINGVYQPLMYLNGVMRDDSAYDVMLTQNDFPLTDQIDSIGHVEELVLSAANSAECWDYMLGKAAEPIVATDSSQNQVRWMPRFTGINDVNPPANVGYNDTTVRSYPFSANYGDTIKVNRVFRLGSYQFGDTLHTTIGLLMPTNWVRMRLLLRDAQNDTIVRVLDTAKLGWMSLTQSASLADSGWLNFTVPSGLPPQVFVSLEASRSLDTMQMAIRHIDSYEENLLDALPPDSTVSFKRPFQPAQASNPDNLSLLCRPNPTTGDLEIEFGSRSAGLRTRIDVYDALGRGVRTIFDGVSDAGEDTFKWDSREAASGTYFVRAVCGSDVRTFEIKVQH